MSRTIDSRVVEMQFDNKQFESNVKTSMSTLDKLKQSLNLTGASKGLENVGTAAKNVNMSGLSGAVETVRIRFSALEVIAVTALANITNSAINAGKRIVSALTIDPVSEGFAEYELKMGSIQTIMAGTGESLETVSRYLDELNVYADRTIYSFADMTSNIGKFTNAGVSLKDSVAAIQGVSNVAAVSGANTNEASRAMYNFAQALSAGYVKLIDWKSIENANMATVEFKTQLLETAVAAGTVTKSADGMYTTLKGHVFNATRNFNDVLQDQWMTTEVLVETLGKYADETTDIGKKAFAAAQDIKTLSQLFDTLKEAAGSGWAQTWEILIGDFEEAKKLLTELGGVIGGFIDRMSDARNELLRLWKENGGRETLIEAFRNSFEALGKIIKPISEAFRDIFPPTTSEQLLNLTNGLKTFTERLKIGDETADKIKRTFAGLFAVLDLVKQGIGFVFNVAGELFGLFGGPAAGGILGVTASIGDLLVKLNEAVREGNIFKRAFETLKEVFTTVAEKITDAITRIKEAFGSFRSVDTRPIDEFSSKAEKSFSPFTRIAQIFGAAFEAIVKVLEWAAPIVAKLGSIVAKGLGALADKVSYAVGHMKFNEILDVINTGLFGAILLGLRNFIKSLTDVTSGAGGFIKGFTGILDGVRGSLEAFQSSLKAKTLLTIASAIGILAASLLVLSMIDSGKLTTALMGITVLFIELSATLTVLGKTMGKTKIAKVSGTMIAMSTAILILSFAMKKLAALDWAGVAKGTVGIAVLAATLVIAANKFDKTSGKLIKGSAGLIALATAVLILSHAVANIAQLSWGELLKGLTGLTVILIEIVKLTRSMGDAKRMISTGLGMMALGAAVNIFASAIAKMGKLSWGEIARGMTAMAGVLKAITVALNSMPKNMISMGVGLMAVGTALSIVSKVLANMGGMSWGEVAKGLIALGGSLLIITKAMNAMTGGLAGAAAMLVMAAAIGVLTPSIKALGRMDLAEIGKALLALIGVFVVVGAAGLVLAPLTPVLLALAGAIALLGVAVLAIGGGLLMFSAGLTALAVAGTAGAAALVVVVTSLLSLIPMALEKLGEGVVAFAKVISNGMPAIMEAVKQIALGLIQVLVEVTPPVVEALLTFLITLLEQLADAVPKMIDAGMRLLLGILEGISEHITDVVVVALNIISEFLRGIAEGIPGIIAAGIDIVVSFLTAIGQETPRIIDAGFKMIIDFINGLADAIRENTPVLGAAMGNLAGAMIEGLVGGITAGVKSVADSVKNLGKNALDGLKNFLGIRSPSKEFENLGMYTSEGFAKGVKGDQGNITATVSDMSAKMLAEIKSSIPKFTEAGSSVMLAFINGAKTQDGNSKNTFTAIISGALTAIKNKYNDFYNAGKYLVEGFADGITANTYLAEARARAMAAAAARAAERELDIRSPSRVGYGIGKYFGTGFVNALVDYTSKSYEAGSEIAKSAKTGLSNTISKITDFINNDIDTQPTIRPVLDLSDVESGTGRLNALFSRTQAMSISTGMSRVSDEEVQNGTNTSGKGNTYQFTQNNYSPKPLSRIEIYRQTKNQISTMKGLVEA